MRFSELIQTVEFPSIWECLQENYCLEEKLFEGYQNAFCDLRNAIPVKQEEEMLLVVAKVHDEFEDEGYYYDVYGVHPGDTERYSLEFAPWEEWLSYEVLEKSVALHGAVAFVAHSLYELTFFGFSITDTKAKVDEKLEMLRESINEIKGGKGKYIPAEEVFEKLGYVDARTDKEKRRDEKRMSDAMEANKRIYADLLDEKEHDA